MPKFKINIFLKSFRNKAVILSALAIVTAIVLITKFFLKNDTGLQNPNDSSIKLSIDSDEIQKPNLEILEKTLDSGIDSVFFNFGTKKEWIKTSYNLKSGKTESNNPQKNAEWFAKEVLIPKELSTIEINLDITRYIESVGLSTSVYENIITKDINININNPDSTASNPLLAKVLVKHSDKVSRDAGVFAIILDNIGDYSSGEIEQYLLNKSEFSFVFPRSLDKVNLQTKLLQNKKDVLINLTVGRKDNYDTDFNMSLDEKAIREKVKSFSTDYPSVSTVILTKSDAEVTKGKMNLISEELNNFNIKVINDSQLSRLIAEAEEESKDKISIIFNNLKSKALLNKTAIAVLNIDSEEFEQFYNKILILKKLGHKFYNITDYLAKEDERQKLEMIREEKLKQEKEERKKYIIKTEIKANDKKKIKPKKNTNDKKK